MSVGEDLEMQRQALRMVLVSETFSRSPNLIRILQYLGKKHLQGESRQVKEYSIAVEALKKPPDFDPVASSVVRVEMRRLREKLKQYYATEGARDPVVVELNAGNYTPSFIFRTEPPGGGSLVSSGPVDSQASSIKDSNKEPANISQGRPSAHERSRLSPRNVLRWWWVFVAAALTLGAIGRALHVRTRATQSAYFNPASHQPLAVLPAVAGESDGAVRIIAGYDKDRYVDSYGNVFKGDRFFSGGRTQSSPRRVIAGTRDPTLFAYGRIGNFSYDIPLQPGSYELWLFFAETALGPGTINNEPAEFKRDFDIQLNGKSLLSGFQPYSDARENFMADPRVFKGVSPASDGILHLRFESLTGDALINAIAVVPASPGKLNPVRMVAQNNTVTDSAGQLWVPDNYFRGGMLRMRQLHVAGTTEPQLFAGMRLGNLEYDLPIANGRYGLNLYFAETFYGGLAPGGVGSRIFDVYCNGRTLLNNFDVMREAGGADRALRKSFHGLEPNAQGKLILTFVPVNDFAFVNAIEVLDES